MNKNQFSFFSPYANSHCSCPIFAFLMHLCVTFLFRQSVPLQRIKYFFFSPCSFASLQNWNVFRYKCRAFFHNGNKNTLTICSQNSSLLCSITTARNCYINNGLFKHQGNALHIYQWNVFRNTQKIKEQKAWGIQNRENIKLTNNRRRTLSFHSMWPSLFVCVRFSQKQNTIKVFAVDSVETLEIIDMVTARELTTWASRFLFLLLL